MEFSFRGLLIFLRQKYKKDSTSYYIYAGVASAVFVLLGLAIDYFTPFESWFMVVRSIVLIPTALALYALLYGFSLQLHFARMESEEWVPYRARFSPKTRLQMTLIASAVLFVLIVSTGKGIGYTPFSSLLGAGILALVAFVRPSLAEQKRAELGVPDVRDLQFDLNKRALEREQKLRELEKKRKKR